MCTTFTLAPVVLLPVVITISVVTMVTVITIISFILSCFLLKHKTASKSTTILIWCLL